MFSGLFSGLTLGLLGLDPIGLDIVQASDSKDAEYARKIAPIRKRGNLLLCTLLLGNVAVNAALSIILSNITSGLVGFLVSTIVIVILGEIVPQAACNRYALVIGAHSIWIVRVLMVLMLPATYPIAKLLDWILGDELGTIYSSTELNKLIRIHITKAESDLKKDAGTIMTGALTFQDKRTRDVMTDIKDVFMLGENSVLNFETLTKIFRAGHSRIPCYFEDDLRGQRVTGLLFVKDLILLDPEDEIPVATMLDVFDHPVLHVWPDYELDNLLNDFCTGRSHIAIVRDVVRDDPNRDPYYVNVGIVTLEDIIEIILQKQIVDESDRYVTMHSKRKQKARPDFDLDKLSLFDYRPKRKNYMSAQEVNAIFNHLRASLNVFNSELNGKHVSDRAFKNMLATCPVIKVDCEDKNDRKLDKDPYAYIGEQGLLVYKYGEPTRVFSIVVEGKVEVRAGKQGFVSELARWTTLCPAVLEQTVEQTKQGMDEIDSFVPDFTCKVVMNSRILQISIERFQDLLGGDFEMEPSRSAWNPRKIDTTGDGKPNAWGVDTTGDGKLNQYLVPVVGIDTTGDNKKDALALDMTGDGNFETVVKPAEIKLDVLNEGDDDEKRDSRNNSPASSKKAKTPGKSPKAKTPSTKAKTPKSKSDSDSSGHNIQGAPRMPFVTTRKSGPIELNQMPTFWQQRRNVPKDKDNDEPSITDTGAKDRGSKI